LLGDETVATDAAFKKTKTEWLAALSLYREQKFNDAEAAFSKLLGGMLGGPAETFIGRIAAIRLNPPGENWDAVFRADSK
jgi:adenylate cyclase